MQTITGQRRNFIDQSLYLQYCGGLAPGSMDLIRRRESIIVISRIVSNRASVAIQSLWRGSFARGVCRKLHGLLSHCALVVQTAARKMLASRYRWRLWRSRVLRKIRGVIVVGSVMACELQKRRNGATQLQRVMRGQYNRLASIQHTSVRKIQAM
jgi:hypothetical protein